MRWARPSSDGCLPLVAFRVQLSEPILLPRSPSPSSPYPPYRPLAHSPAASITAATPDARLRRARAHGRPSPSPSSPTSAALPPPVTTFVFAASSSALRASPLAATAPSRFAPASSPALRSPSRAAAAPDYITHLAADVGDIPLESGPLDVRFGASEPAYQLPRAASRLSPSGGGGGSASVLEFAAEATSPATPEHAERTYAGRPYQRGGMRLLGTTHAAASATSLSPRSTSRAADASGTLAVGTPVRWLAASASAADMSTSQLSLSPADSAEAESRHFPPPPPPAPPPPLPSPVPSLTGAPARTCATVASTTGLDSAVAHYGGKDSSTRSGGRDGASCAFHDAFTAGPDCFDAVLPVVEPMMMYRSVRGEMCCTSL